MFNFVDDKRVNGGRRMNLISLALCVFFTTMLTLILLIQWFKISTDVIKTV